MPRFTVKDMLRGLTLASVGFGMLALAFGQFAEPATKELKLLQAFLVGFGGMFIGYGFAFPVKWPPNRMVLAMTGVFAAQAWHTGTLFGLLLYLSLLPLMLLVNWRMRITSEDKRNTPTR